MHGYFGKILRIDLSTGKIRVEELAGEVYQSYLGGKGLGSYLLLREVGAGTDPLSPENKLIFATGPLSDSPVWGSSRYAVLSLSPLTGFYADSYAGGSLAPVMKRCGYDAFIIEGRAAAPVFIRVTGDEVSIESAENLWGRDCYDSTKALEQAGGKGAKAIVIGPAGENLVKVAALQSDLWRSAARCGLGAVAGSKNLKGIVFNGDHPTVFADEARLKKISRDYFVLYKDNPGAIATRALGTVSGVEMMNTAGGFPTGYWQEGRLPGWEKVSSDYMEENMDVKPRACKRCFLACAKKNRVPAGTHKGLVLEGPEYETIYAFAGLCKIDSFEEVLYLNDLCDRLGLDTISAGNLASLAIEAGLRGQMEPLCKYSDPAGVASFLNALARRDPAVEVFALGIREAAQALGLSELAIHVKGLEPAGYDPRALQGMALAYATAARGACHLRTTFYMPELSRMVTLDDVEHLVEVFCDFEDRFAVMDSFIMCRFFRDFTDWEYFSKLVSSALGLEYDVSQLRSIGAKIIDQSRVFNQRQGLTAGDDSLPERFFTEPLVVDGKKEQVVDRELFSRMIAGYYKQRRWDVDGICS